MSGDLPERGAVLAGRFRLDAVLGEGGMGVVWEASELATGEKVAVKLVKSNEPEARRRFLREARSATAVKHPNVVAVREVLDLDDGGSAIVMERLEGESLAAKLEREHHLSVSEAARLVLPVVSAVGAAHALGIVHRDLKPENIFLARTVADGGGERVVVKVLDFGIAKTTLKYDEGQPTTTLTASGVVLGTPYYMSPEQVFGESDVDHRADVWALGLVLYKCLSGVLPTRGENAGQMLKLILTAHLPPLRDAAPDVPEELASVVDRMLLARADRLSDLHEVRDALTRYAEVDAPEFGASGVPVADDVPTAGEQRIIRVASSSADSRSAVFAQTEASKPAAALSPSPPRSRRLGAWIAVGLGVAAATIGAAFAVRRATRPQIAAAMAATATATPPVSPISADAGILGCPVLEASGVDAPTGWLGAAGAELACRRAMWLMGGRLERVLFPADLLDLPRQPTKDFPPDPYVATDARAKTIDAAKKRAQAYLDGSVRKDAKSFAVTLKLRSPDGSELGSSVGDGSTIYDATGAAVEALATAGALPRKRELDAEVAKWLFVKRVDTQLLVESIGGEWTSIEAPCHELFAARAELVDAPWIAGACSTVFPAWYHDLPPAKLDFSSTPRLMITSYDVADRDPSADVEGALAQLTKDGERATFGWARNAIELAVAKLWLRQKNSDLAAAAFLRAIAATPSDGFGWGSLAQSERDDLRKDAVVAWNAWLPSAPLAWSALADVAPDSPARVRYLRRAVGVQGPWNDYRVRLAGAALLAGDTAEARAVASSLGDDTADHRMGRAYLIGRVNAQEGRLSAAFDQIRAALLAERGPQNAVAKSSLWYQAILLGRLLGRKADWADAAARAFVIDAADDEALVDGAEALSVFLCLEASSALGHACAERLEELGKKKAFSWTYGARPLLEGTRRYVVGDLRGAVEAWRPLLRDPSKQYKFLPVEAFDQVGEHDLAETIDRDVLADTFYRGISVAHPRVARRAFAKGDKARAREFAQQVVDAWSVADVKLPVVDEMRAILDKTK